MTSWLENAARIATDIALRPGDEPPIAAHLVSPRTWYTHHGIYVGCGRVVHYSGLGSGLRRGPVVEVTLDAFAHGHGIRLREERRGFEPDEVIRRARSRLGEDRYRLFTNNCEHFCLWVLRNQSCSWQVERLGELTRGLLNPFKTLSRHVSRILP